MSLSFLSAETNLEKCWTRLLCSFVGYFNCVALSCHCSFLIVSPFGFLGRLFFVFVVFACCFICRPSAK